MEAGGMLADRYRLVAPVARGAQGTVWRAVDTHGGGDVAVKVPGGTCGNADVESLLRLVCEQSVRIGHPHVLAPLDWFVRDTEAWLVLPLVRGGTLAGLLADYGELPPSVALLIAEQLLDALAAVHAAGFVHRDVKPSNVLLAATGEGRPHTFLADFGVARVLPHLQLTSPAYVPGTPDYLAPEIRAGAVSTPAQDVYAAGLVLRSLGGGPPALAAAMLADRSEDRPSAAAARDEIARARQALGPERWPVIWADEPFVVPDQFGDAPPAPARDQFGDAPPAPALPAAPPVVPGRRRAAGVWVVAAAVAGAAVIAVAATVALTAAETEKGSPPPRTVPADTVIGPADPEGPTAYTECTSDEELDLEFSPEGYALLCAHVPGTRRYEWTPSSG
ncbi:serine/threonine-protein kinase [Streptomyces sp. NPDC059875]|uniref:serine/threonine-protein kinase n=1 Tax=unclassified Streptomyces TaxID=2593676 RepID=UPI0036546903